MSLQAARRAGTSWVDMVTTEFIGAVIKLREEKRSKTQDVLMVKVGPKVSCLVQERRQEQFGRDYIRLSVYKVVRSQGEGL
jgi:hypothetical protein